MLSGNPLFPEQSSILASDVDRLYFFVVAVTSFFALLVVISVVVFAIKYRERTDDRVGAPMTGLMPLELGWSIVPFFSSMAIFGWATVVCFDLGRAPDQTMDSYLTGIGRGEQLFHQLGCGSCHLHDGSGRGPSLAGKYGAHETLANGTVIYVDDSYLRESILTPQMRLVAGYRPLMSTFQDQVNEEGLISLIDYIKSIPSGQPLAAPPDASAAPAGQSGPR
jgi:mono/diheme cytochrome c family protein